MNAVAGQQSRHLTGRQPAAPASTAQIGPDHSAGVIRRHVGEFTEVTGGPGPPGAVGHRPGQGVRGCLRIGVGRDGTRRPGCAWPGRSSSPGVARDRSRTASGWSSTTAARGTRTSAARIAATRSPVAAVGRASARTASTPSSAAASSRQRRNEFSLTVAVVSTGPVTAPLRGTSACSRRRVWPVSRARSGRAASRHRRPGRRPQRRSTQLRPPGRPEGVGWPAGRPHRRVRPGHRSR